MEDKIQNNLDRLFYLIVNNNNNIKKKKLKDINFYLEYIIKKTEEEINENKNLKKQKELERKIKDKYDEILESNKYDEEQLNKINKIKKDIYNYNLSIEELEDKKDEIEGIYNYIFYCGKEFDLMGKIYYSIIDNLEQITIYDYISLLKKNNLVIFDDYNEKTKFDDYKENYGMYINYKYNLYQNYINSKKSYFIKNYKQKNFKYENNVYKFYLNMSDIIHYNFKIEDFGYEEVYLLIGKYKISAYLKDNIWQFRYFNSLKNSLVISNLTNKREIIIKTKKEFKHNVRYTLYYCPNDYEYHFGRTFIIRNGDKFKSDNYKYKKKNYKEIILKFNKFKDLCYLYLK